jgi:hypothetical protein
MKYCIIVGCNSTYRAKNLCKKHYDAERNRRISAAKPPRPVRIPKPINPAYRSYYAMRSRCLNPNFTDYHNYGGRGIQICERWLGEDGYGNFIADMGERPERTTLDRLDVNGNYEPSNCRWASWSMQAANRRNSRAYVGIKEVPTLTGISYEAKLMVKRKVVLSKTFHTLEEAIEARKKAQLEYPDA